MIVEQIPEGAPGRDVDIAWAAGFWDGEGSFIADNRSCVVSLQVSQAGDEGHALLARFARALGQPATIYEGWRKTERHKPAYKVHIIGERAVRAYELCKPYLSETKKQQAEGRIAAWRQRQASFVHSSTSKTHCPEGHSYSDANTFINSRGARCCRTCRRIRGRARYEASRTALGLTVTPRMASRAPEVGSDR
jgi:hypothetical protein